MTKNQIKFMPAFYQNYVDAVMGDDILEILEKEQAITQQFIAEIPSEKENYSYAEGKWTIKDVFQHLIDTERIMTYRALRFARHDKTELAGFEQDDFVKFANASNRGLQEIAKEFAIVRQSSIALFKSFDDEMFLQSGISNSNQIQVLGFAYIVAGHEIHHRRILKERYLGN